MQRPTERDTIRCELSTPGAALLGRYSPVAHDVPDLRAVLHTSAVGRVTMLSVSAANVPPHGYSPDFQVALPIVGLFTWKVGSMDAVIDANTALFISAGQEYAERHPILGLGHASALVDPSPHIVDEIRGLRGFGSRDPFEAVTRAASARAQLLTHRLMRLAPEDADAADELIVAHLLELAQVEAPAPGAPKAVVGKAKQYIHELGGRRLSLDAAASAIGVSPIYLTQAFKASEGIPLYRYHLNLRLSQALGQLPHRESITDLALELGFSSHSHFSAAFLARFGVSPSAYRDLSRLQRGARGSWWTR